MKLSWIIPAYNEEKRIEKTVREVNSYLSKKFSVGEYEIIVVNNGSKDNTGKIVEGMKSQVIGLRLTDMHQGGKGAAVKKGMLEGLGEIRLFSDADNSTAPEYFDKMEPFFQKKFDIVISSRNSRDANGAGRDVEEPPLRELMGRLGNLIIQIFGVWGIWDTQNGFKAFTAKSAEEIFSKVSMRGFSFDIEVLAIAKFLGYKIAIIPVRWRYEAGSKVNLSSYIKVFADVFKIRANLILKKYAKKS